MAFTNGDFETGDLTGWTKSESYGTVTVTTGSKQSGTYGCNFTITTDDDGEGELYIEQDISTSFTAITIPFKVAAYDAPPGMALRYTVSFSVLDSEEVPKTIYPFAGTWVTISSAADWANIDITKSTIEGYFSAGDHWDTTTTVRIRLIVTV